MSNRVAIEDGVSINVDKLKAKLQEKYPNHNFDIPPPPDTRCKKEYECKRLNNITYTDKEGNIYCGRRYKLDKERGGFVFMLPNSEGDIYLTWEDMYSVDVTFVNTKANYKEVVTLPTLEVLIQTLEDQRQRTVDGLRDMLKEKFSSE